MGSFQGHFLPAVYFMLFGLRWSYCVLMRYYLGRRESALGRPNPRVFKNSPFFPVSCRPGMPIEACCLLIGILFEFTGEIVSGIFKFGFIANGQHMTVFFFFIVTSIVAILKHYRMITIPNTDYGMVILSFMVYGFVFYYHTIHKTMLEAQIHINMVQICVFVTISLAVEMMRPHSFGAACVRCLSISIAGSWMMHIGFILYYPYEEPWDQSSPMYLKLAAMMLMWHLAGNLLRLFVLAAFVRYRVQNMSPTEVQTALDITYSNTTASSDGCKKTGEQDKYLLGQSDDECV